MKITKLGHCCLLIEEKGIKILTDPGMFSDTQNEVKGIDCILITHEHPDHLHLESLKKVLENNPNATVITNTAVGNILKSEDIAYKIVEDAQNTTHKDIAIEGYGNTHAEIYKEIGQVQNTGYFIGNRFFYPGDALYIPPKQAEILALPVAGPWVKTKEVIEYAQAVKPKTCFPVHDGILSYIKPFHMAPEKALKEMGIEFIPMVAGDAREF